MKKLSTALALLSVICLLFCFAVNVSAAKVYTDGIFSYTVSSSGTATITAIDSSVTGEVVVPSTIGGYDVKYFGDCFRYNTGITSVVLSEGIASISYDAFLDCSNLEYLYVPSTVSGIGSRAFDYTKSLKKIDVNENNKWFCSENGVLYNKEMTEILVFPADNEMKSFDMPDTVTSIKENCFSDSLIEEIIISDACVQIGSSAFYDCDNLTAVTFNDGLQLIEKWAFNGCRKIEKMTLPSSLVEIKAQGFAYCNSLKQIVIPEGVKILGEKAFFSCDAVTEVLISSTVESIGFRAFGDYSKLQKIIVSENNPYYTADENGIFFNKDKTELIEVPQCNGITEYVLPESVLSIADSAFSYHKTLTKITFSEALQYIGDNAFFSCDYLAGEIKIPASLEHIGTKVFFVCKYIDAFNVDSDNQYFSSDENNILYDKEKTMLILYPAGSKLKEYVVPATVSVIKEYAIHYANNLRTLVISDNVTDMEEYSIHSCSLLENIFIGKGLSSISGAAFPYCRITEITVSDENEFFCSVDGVLYSKDKTILYKYPSRTPGESYIIADTVKTINNEAFVYASNLKNVIVPSNVSEIGYGAFHSCYGLENLTIVNPAVNLSSYLLSTPNTKTTVYGYRNSTAEKLCDRNNFMFTPLADGLSVDFEDGVLIVSGAEELPVIDDEKMSPWVALAPITECILIEDVSVINEATFSSFPDISALILKSDAVSINDGAFANCNKLRTVIAFGDVAFSEYAFSKETENLLFFAETGKTVSDYKNLIKFSYFEDEDGDKVVKFDGDVTIEHYDFFNLVAAVCDRYGEVNELEFTQFTLLNGNIEKVDINGKEVNRTEISSFENNRLAVQILDEETYDVITVSFNELCEGVANEEIDRFLLVVINEEEEIENEVIVDSDEVKDEESFSSLILRALITFFNKILRLFRR